MKNVLVIGGGSWGSCLAKLLVENGSNVYLWEHSEKNRDIMKKERKTQDSSKGKRGSRGVWQNAWPPAPEAHPSGVASGG